MASLRFQQCGEPGIDERAGGHRIACPEERRLASAPTACFLGCCLANSIGAMAVHDAIRRERHMGSSRPKSTCADCGKEIGLMSRSKSPRGWICIDCYQKATCENCGKKVGWNRSEIADGWICSSCFKLCGYKASTPIAAKTIGDVRADIGKVEEQKAKLAVFRATKKIDRYIEFDEAKRQWLIPDGFWGGKKNPRVYDFDDVVEYELLEDGDTILKGGLGSAVVGGLLLGGVGAIVGAATGAKRTKSIVRSLRVKITVDNFGDPVVYINLITTETRVGSWVYKNQYGIAQQILSAFALIRKREDGPEPTAVHDKSTEAPPSPADEILKYKALLDNGAITLDEFETIKKRLLSL